jgi:hypothetical protein
VKLQSNTAGGKDEGLLPLLLLDDDDDDDADEEDEALESRFPSP